MTEEERLAEIGRAVVAHYRPGDPTALREATPELVLREIKRMENSMRALENSRALRTGKLALALCNILRAQP